MRIGSRACALALSLSAVVALGSIPLLAQEASKAKEGDARPAAKRTVDPTRRVPDYFGQLGLSTEQKESIYKIRAKHDEQISALRKQLTEAQAKMILECEGVLTASQKELLDARRRSAREARKSSARAKADSASAAKDESKKASN